MGSGLVQVVFEQLLVAPLPTSMTRRARALPAIGLILLVALPALAWRREYATTVDGKRKAGSEVCFYRGVKGDAFSLFFTSGTVACRPADAVLDFSPGLVHVFARHKDGYASAHRDYTVLEGAPGPEQGYERLEIPMVRAGIVDFGSTLKALEKTQRVGLWIASSPTTSGTFIPLVPGESTIVAPAEMIVIPLMIEDGMPAAVGEPLDLAPGERQAAVLRPPTPTDTSDVIVWTRADHRSLEALQGQPPPPAITIKVGERTFQPVSPLFDDLNSFGIFRNVPRGKAIVTVQGRMWKPVRREITLSGPLVVEREPIPLVAGGNILLRWPAGDAHTPASDCSAAPLADAPRIKATLMQCATSSAGEKKCSPAGQQSIPYGTATSLSFDGVQTGSYTVTLEPPYGKRQSVAVDVVSGRVTTADVSFPLFSFFGSVTVNGAPIHARLIFSSGQAVTGVDGRYTATLAGDPLANQIGIERCSDARIFTFIPHASPQPNGVYDIDLPLATLNVSVVDADHAPVADAAVRFSPIKEVHPDGNEVYFGSAEKKTDADGNVRFDDVPAGFKVSVCAAQKRFGRKCAPPIDVNAQGDVPAIVQFDRVGLRGRVEGHTGEGSITIVNPAGIVTEEAPLDADGSFLLHAAHAAPEYLVYVSRARPLTVLPLPMLPPPELMVTVPAAPSRTFTVSAPAMKADSGFVGVWVGGRYVPLQVLSTHQELRGRDSILQRNRTLEIRDIAETAPITIALGQPDLTARTFVDVFTLPQYAGVSRVPVQGSSIVLGGN